MRLLRFRASSTALAMARVRSELGGEAVILSTRRIDGAVEITAGIEPPGDVGALVPPRLDPPAPPAGALEERTAMLRRHGTPDGIASRLRAGPLAFALSLALRFAPLRWDGPVPVPPLLLVGPPGAGKTLTVARLATRLVLAGARPVVVTTDARRAGATEQLAAFTRLLGLSLHDCGDRAALSAALAERTPGTPVLVDTAGVDCFASRDLADLAGLAASLAAEPVAVLPAGGDPEETREMAQALAGIGARRLVATRTDLARRLGGVLAAAHVLALGELGVGPGAADGLAAATPGLLARRLIGPHPALATPSGAAS